MDRMQHRAGCANDAPRPAHTARKRERIGVVEPDSSSVQLDEIRGDVRGGLCLRRRTILVHEQAHQRLGHSWDLLLVDLLGCLQWFNPAMWLLRVELRAVHEYEADEQVLRCGVDAKDYQMLLIKKAVGGRWYSIANSLNHSNLKNRITMMLRKRSSRWARAKALYVLRLRAWRSALSHRPPMSFRRTKLRKIRKR